MRTLFALIGLTAGLIAGPAIAQSTPSGGAGPDVPIVSGPEIRGETFEYATGGQTYQGYLARNVGDSTPRPAVLVVHEWWGLDDYARARADQLAALGFVALAVDMYGDGQTAGHPDQAGEFASRVMQDWPAARGRLEAAINRLRQHPAVADEGMAVIGYCFGGSVAMNMALSGMPIDVAISFHGAPTLAVEAPQAFDGAVQIHNGAADPLIEREALSTMARTLAARGAEVEVIDYPGATHGFTNPGADALGEAFGLPLGYDAAADAASWQSALLLLGRTFFE